MAVTDRALVLVARMAWAGAAPAMARNSARFAVRSSIAASMTTSAVATAAVTIGREREPTQAVADPRVWVTVLRRSTSESRRDPIAGGRRDLGRLVADRDPIAGLKSDLGDADPHRPGPDDADDLDIRRGHRGPSAGQDPERPASHRGDRSEVSFVERQQVDGPVAPRQDHDRGIGETQGEVGVPVEHAGGLCDVVRVEPLELVRATGDLGEEGSRGLRRHSRSQQVVEFREHERREQPRGITREEGGP